MDSLWHVASNNYKYLFPFQVHDNWTFTSGTYIIFPHWQPNNNEPPDVDESFLTIHWNDQSVVLFTSFIPFYSQHCNLVFFLSQMTKHILYSSFLISRWTNQCQLYGHNGIILTFSTVITRAGTNSTYGSWFKSEWGFLQKFRYGSYYSLKNWKRLLEKNRINIFVIIQYF